MLSSRLTVSLTGLSAVFLGAALAAQSPIAGVWRFDETTGTTAADSGPLGNNGTLINFSGTPWVLGRLGNSLLFDGVDDYVDITFNAGLPFYTGHGEAFTIAFWVKGSATEDDRVVSLSSSLGGDPLFTLGTGRSSLANQSKLQVFRRSDGSGEYPQRYTVADVFDDTWHHVTYVEHSSFARVFVDGQPDISFTVDTGTRFVPTDILTFGGIHRPSTASPLCCNFTGEIDDLHVYTYPLSPADIATVMAGNIAFPLRASVSTFGAGCSSPASFGPFSLIAFGGPVLGGALDFRVTGGSAGGSPLLVLAVGAPQVLDLRPFGGAPGCALYTPLAGSAVTLPLPPLDAFGSSLAGMPMPIPAIPALSGIELTFQAIEISPLIASNGVLALLGS